MQSWKMIITLNGRVFHRLYTIVVEKVYSMGKKGKLNVYECCNQVWKSVINRGLIRSLSINLIVILGSSLTETPPNVKRVVVMLLRKFHFHTYNILYIITLDMYSETQYNNTIETNTFSPQVS